MPKTAKPRRHGEGWQINWYDGTGKRHFKTFRTHEEAVQALRHHNVRADEAKAGLCRPENRDLTFSDLADRWLEAKDHKRSISDDESRLRVHLKPAFGHLKVVDITTAQIDRFRQDLMKRRARNTVRLVLALLRSMLRLAERRGWIGRAPIVELPRNVETPYQWIETDEEIRRLLEVAEEYDYPGLSVFYATAVYTGMRAGEVCGLRWNDVSFRRRLITVQRSWDTPTKSNKVRHVPILDPLLPLLTDWAEVGLHDTVVFPNKRGNAQSKQPHIVNRVFKKCLEEADIDDLPFHGLRHTFASHWVLNGGDLYRLQRILGHASIDTTQRYAHLAPDAFQQDWGRLGSGS